MNIQEAKEEIARTIRAYTKRNPDGTHRIPPEKQRPLFLVGPPGIGKTAIMKQIAAETGCGLVAYSMTHHTRQSAIGLPFIAEKEYGGQKCPVTEYTMSEIVASIYDYMEATGKRSGILFLDEINCVSETLAPVMLQLLQNKTFGNVPLPEDWIIVTAGNPPEYNKSVREMDMVTLDRVKHMEIEADLAVWQRYALANDVHPAIRAYLSVYPDHFYNITDTDRGQLFVTARGWEDLSLMLTEYEEEGVTVDAKWFLQYLQHDEIARSFGLYYGLFRHFSRKLAETADAEEAGNVPEADRAGQSGTALGRMMLADPESLRRRTATECLAIAAMLFHGIQTQARECARDEAALARRKELTGLLPADEEFRVEETALEFFRQKREAVRIRTEVGLVKPEEELREKTVLDVMEQDAADWRRADGAPNASESFRAFEERRTAEEDARIAAKAAQIAAQAEEAYAVLEHCPQGRSALLYLTGDLSGDPDCERIVSAQRIDAYEQYCAELLTQE